MFCCEPFVVPTCHETVKHAARPTQLVVCKQLTDDPGFATADTRHLDAVVLYVARCVSHATRAIQQRIVAVNRVASSL